MNIKKFTQSLGGGFSRQKLIESFLLTGREMSTETVPCLEEFVKRVPAGMFTKNTVGTFNRDYMRDAKSWGKGKNMFENISEVFAAVGTMSGNIEDEINASIKKTDNMDSITYKGAILAQYVQALTFANNYARKFMLYSTFLINEESVSKKSLTFDSGLSQSQIEWLNNMSDQFFTAMRILSLVASSKSMSTGLKVVPDLVVSLTDESVIAALHKGDVLDPFGMASFGENLSRPKHGFVFTSPAFSIIYHVRMAYADWEIKKLEAAKVDREALEYRIQALTDSIAGENNPKMEEVIERHTERLMEINSVITKIEGSVHERE